MKKFATRELSMVIALVAIWAFFAWQEPVFLSPRNLSLLSVELAVTATLALGMLIVLLPGQIDLSRAAAWALRGGRGRARLLARRAAPVALLIAAAGAVVVWAGMGALIAMSASRPSSSRWADCSCSAACTGS